MLALQAVLGKTVLRSKCTPVLISCMNEQLGGVRYAGGGGRPGGKPTFSWKERRDLGLRKKGEKHKVLKIKDFGDFEDIEQFIDESRGDFLIDVSNEENFDFTGYGLGTPEEEAELEAALAKQNNTRKQIHRGLLFGSNKTAGRLLKKYNYDRNVFVVGGAPSGDQEKKRARKEFRIASNNSTATA